MKYTKVINRLHANILTTTCSVHQVIANAVIFRSVVHQSLPCHFNQANGINR